MLPFVPRRLLLVALALCLAGSGLAAALDAARQRARDLGLAESESWVKLLSYKRTWRGWAGRVRESDFYLSPRGRRDPAAELEANLEALLQPAPGAEPLDCRFPARAAWLRESLALSSPAPACPRFEAWRARLDPETVSLIFASAYMANPASMYGHTFLRLNRRGRPGTERLNDYCVNFAAETNDQSGFVFALRGLFGGYEGKFSTFPYYMQVQRYSNLESRDLWEYDLALSSAAMDRLTRHLWEMGSARFRYLFLTDNCSYALLPLLEAAEPALDMSSAYRFKVIPVDTVRSVLDAGLVTDVRRRPALVRTVLARRALLSPEERRTVEALGRGGEDFAALPPLPPERRALVLDSALDLFRYRRGFARFLSPADEAAERRLLLARGAVPVDPDRVPAPEIAEEDPPESGHATGRVQLGAGRTRGSAAAELSLRPALHDFLDNPTGYVPASRLDMFHLALRWREGGPLYLQRLALIDIQSLSPLEDWVRKPSWKAFLGAETADDRPRDPEDALTFRGAYGHGVSAGRSDGALAYLMGEGDAGLGGVFDRGFRTGWGASAGLLWQAGPRARLWGEAALWRYFWGDVDTVPRLQAGAALDAGRRATLRIQLRRNGDAREAMASAGWYL